MLSLSQLASELKPERTVLFLGAGASIPSGAPSGVQLIALVRAHLGDPTEKVSTFAEECSLLEMQHGRDALVEAIRTPLQSLTPHGGIELIPRFKWRSIYTTNFDLLVEHAYRAANVPLAVVTSNMDYHRADDDNLLPLLKLHGCIGNASGEGGRARIVVTERDHEESSQFRETLFNRLRFEMTTKDVLFVGYSLSDSDLSGHIKEAARLHRESHTPGKLYCLIYEHDEMRARLLEQYGLRVAFGGIDDLLDSLVSSPREDLATPPSFRAHRLPAQLIPTTDDPAQLAQRAPNAVRLFEGSPATYADIANQLTFERSLELQMLNAIADGALSISITGPAGVGKSTLGRRLLNRLRESGYHAWEHKHEFPLRSERWLELEQSLREKGEYGVLLIDDAPSHQRAVNQLADELSAKDNAHLSVILTAESSQWSVRTKSAALFSRGRVVSLSRLDSAEISRLVDLAAREPIVRLVDARFAAQSRNAREEHLRKRCNADMFVALKNLFATDLLDNIILREFNALGEDGDSTLKRAQEIYRNVAALQLAGLHVHRQVMLRMFSIPADDIAVLLTSLEGLVEEYDLDAENGMFGWRTRHEVIADVIYRYKFADNADRYALLRRAALSFNPAIAIERRSLIDLCNRDRGIRGLTLPSQKITLYELLVTLMPHERVPRHRLISEHLAQGNLADADRALREADEVVGYDPPLQRYRIQLLVKRAESTPRLATEDRRALLLGAWDEALRAVQRKRPDMYAFFTLLDVARSLAQTAGDATRLDEALGLARLGCEQLLDPKLSERVHKFESDVGMYRRHAAEMQATLTARLAAEDPEASEK